MTEILEIAKDFAEDLAPHVISQTGTVKTFTAEQVSALYHIAVDLRNEEASVDVELPAGVVESLGEVS